MLSEDAVQKIKYLVIVWYQCIILYGLYGTNELVGGTLDYIFPFELRMWAA